MPMTNTYQQVAAAAERAFRSNAAIPQDIRRHLAVLLTINTTPPPIDEVQQLGADAAALIAHHIPQPSDRRHELNVSDLVPSLEPYFVKITIILQRQSAGQWLAERTTSSS